ncbi:MAG: hypothetical protein K0S32_2791 [Bacteroidetes bacterium]|jgi:hypothetical protein|nr:hypothetical protein [Bacteroidota bacterium]
MSEKKQFNLWWIKMLSHLGFDGNELREEINEAEESLQREKEEFDLRAKKVFENSTKELPDSLIDLFIRASIFRKKKNLVKELGENLLSSFFFLVFVSCPIWFCFENFSFLKSNGYLLLGGMWFASAFIGLGIGFLVSFFSEYFSHLESKITKLGSSSVDFMLFGLLHFLTWHAYNTCDTNFEILLLMSLLGSLVLIDGMVIGSFLVRMFVDIYYYSKKTVLTDELIIESTYKLSYNSNWSEVIRKRSKRNEVLSEIERLARLIENDWSSHIVSGDDKTEKWKRQTLTGIANSIRRLKREIIIPSENSSKLLYDRFENIFKNILLHNFQELKDESVAASRIKKKSLLVSFKGIFVAVIPITGAVYVYKYSPNLIPEDYKGIPIIISAGWLILCLLLWLDPQIGEKISVLKNTKNIFSSSSKE